MKPLKVNLCVQNILLFFKNEIAIEHAKIFGDSRVILNASVLSTKLVSEETNILVLRWVKKEIKLVNQILDFKSKTQRDRFDAGAMYMFNLPSLS